jgi:hypothetical protein
MDFVNFLEYRLSPGQNSFLSRGPLVASSVANHELADAKARRLNESRLTEIITRYGPFTIVCRVTRFPVMISANSGPN